MGIKHLRLVQEDLAMENWEQVLLSEEVCLRLVESEELYVPFDVSDTVIVYKWLSDWLNAHIVGKYFGAIRPEGIIISFSRPSEAVRFKLTFGSAKD